MSNAWDVDRYLPTVLIVLLSRLFFWEGGVHHSLSMHDPPPSGHKARARPQQPAQHQTLTAHAMAGNGGKRKKNKKKKSEPLTLRCLSQPFESR